MYMTWDLFFMFCSLILDLLTLIILIFQNRKKK